MRVLILAPHPDVESIGCGGSVLNHRARGDHVAIVAVTSGEGGLKQVPTEQARATREAEREAAARILGVPQTYMLRRTDYGLSDQISEAAGDLAEILRRETPDLIYLPHARD